MRARSSLLIGLLLVAAALAGCSVRPVDTAPSSAALLPSVQATTFGDSVHFVLQVTNTTDAPVELEFRSGQRFDFVVERAGSEVWRWSGDRMFTQALQHETLPAGETLTFSATWMPPPGLQGEFSVRGILTDSEHRVAQSAAFRIP